MDEKPNIKHLVISGGCIWGLYEYGALKELHESGFWNNESIESIYGTSVGSLIAVILALKIDFETFDTYIIDRPWDEVFKKHSYNIIEIYNNRGVFDIQVFIDFFSPILKSCDMETSITMGEFYEKTGIELHIYITELNRFESIDISYKTHPEWNVIEAVYASCTIPTIFSPIIKEDKCYIDGGFFYNYPLKKCLENVEERDTILGISIGNPIGEDEVKTIITNNSTILDLTSVLLNRVIKNIIFTNEDAGIIKHELIFYTQVTSLDGMMKIVSSKEERRSMIESGVQKAKDYFSNVV